MKMRTRYWLIIVIAIIGVLAAKRTLLPEGRASYKGLTVGSTQAQVLDALGEPDKKVQHGANMMWYFGKGTEQRDPIGDPEVWFDENGKVASIDLHSSDIKIGESAVIGFGDRQKDVFAKLGKPDVLTDYSKGSNYYVFAEFHRYELAVGFYGKKKVGRIFIGSGKNGD